MSWFLDHLGDVLDLTVRHIYLAGVPLILGLLIHLFEGNILAPLVMSVQVELPPVVTMFGILVMGALLGPLGVLMAVPAIAVIDVFIRRIVVERIYLSERFRPPPAPDSPAAP